MLFARFFLVTALASAALVYPQGSLAEADMSPTPLDEEEDLAEVDMSPTPSEDEDSAEDTTPQTPLKWATIKLPSLKTHTGMECGVHQYKAARSAHCGVETYRRARGAACGISYHNSGTSSVCGQECDDKCVERIIGVGTCTKRKKTCYDKSCRHKSFGTIYRSCRHQNFGVEAYRSCRRPEFGIESYKSCELRMTKREIDVFIAGVQPKIQEAINTFEQYRQHYQQIYTATRQAACAIHSLDKASPDSLRVMSAQVEFLAYFGVEYDTSLCTDSEVASVSISCSGTDKDVCMTKLQQINDYLGSVTQTVKAILNDHLGREDQRYRDILSDILSSSELALEYFTYFNAQGGEAQ